MEAKSTAVPTKVEMISPKKSEVGTNEKNEITLCHAFTSGDHVIYLQLSPDVWT